MAYHPRQDVGQLRLPTPRCDFCDNCNGSLAPGYRGSLQRPCTACYHRQMGDQWTIMRDLVISPDENLNHSTQNSPSQPLTHSQAASTSDFTVNQSMDEGQHVSQPPHLIRSCRTAAELISLGRQHDAREHQLPGPLKPTSYARHSVSPERLTAAETLVVFSKSRELHVDTDVLHQEISHGTSHSCLRNTISISHDSNSDLDGSRVDDNDEEAFHSQADTPDVPTSSARPIIKSKTPVQHKATFVYSDDSLRSPSSSPSEEASDYEPQATTRRSTSHSNHSRPALRSLTMNPKVAEPAKRILKMWGEREKSYVQDVVREVCEANIPGVRTEQRWDLFSERLASKFSVDRSASSIKNYWNREGRADSGFDERNKKKPNRMVTGVQDKEQRTAARRLKRDSQDSGKQSSQNIHRASMRNKGTSQGQMTIKRSASMKSLTYTGQNSSRASSQEQVAEDPTSDANKKDEYQGYPGEDSREHDEPPSTSRALKEQSDAKTGLRGTKMTSETSFCRPAPANSSRRKRRDGIEDVSRARPWDL